MQTSLLRSPIRRLFPAWATWFVRPITGPQHRISLEAPGDRKWSVSALFFSTLSPSRLAGSFYYSIPAVTNYGHADSQSTAVCAKRRATQERLLILSLSNICFTHLHAVLDSALDIVQYFLTVYSSSRRSQSWPRLLFHSCFEDLHSQLTSFH